MAVFFYALIFSASGGLRHPQMNWDTTMETSIRGILKWMKVGADADGQPVLLMVYWILGWAGLA